MSNIHPMPPQKPSPDCQAAATVDPSAGRFERQGCAICHHLFRSATTIHKQQAIRLPPFFFASAFHSISSSSASSLGIQSALQVGRWDCHSDFLPLLFLKSIFPQAAERLFSPKPLRISHNSSPLSSIPRATRSSLKRLQIPVILSVFLPALYERISLSNRSEYRGPIKLHHKRSRTHE
jgi:hypothetical protein